MKKINDYEYTSTAIGTNNYSIYLDVSHPRRSTCTCPLSNEKRIICKHIVATFFTAFPEETKDFFEEETGSKIVSKDNALNYQYIDENKLIER